MSAPPLFANQVESIAWMRERDIWMDASDPGTGKTRSEAEIIREFLEQDGRATLVLCPKTLIRSAWRNDLLKYTPGVITSCAYAENREEAFRQPADVYITNIDAVKWLAKQPPKFFKRFGRLIMDESGGYKHHDSQRSKAARLIAQHFEFRAAMNGTVNPNTILDVWHQYFLLDFGKRLGKSYYHFRNAVCQPKQVGPQPNMIKWEDRPGAEQVVAGLVKDITIRHVFEDCVDIPKNHEYVVPFLMAKKQAKVYSEMANTMIARLNTGNVSAINAAAVSTKLLQIASGAVYENEFLYHIVDEERNELIMDLLENRAHSLVFFNWRHQKDQLVAAAQRRGYSYCVLDGEVAQGQREENVRLFEQGFYKICFAHPQSAAHGLTLIKATTTLWASPTPNAEFFMQGNRRIYRAGQTQKTETIVIIAEGTIDERVYYDILGPKRVRMADLLMELREAA